MQGTVYQRKNRVTPGVYRTERTFSRNWELIPAKEVHTYLKELILDYESNEEIGMTEILNFHVRFERIFPFEDGNGRVGRLIMFKECLANGLVPFIIADDMKAFYYRGLSEWDYEKGFLTDTCLASQDRFKAVLNYFRIPFDQGED